jgi:hypothetical protein
MRRTGSESFLSFVRENSQAELMIVHRLLVRGLERLAAQEPGQVLEYLLGDPRRLVIGDHWDKFRETKRLIAAVCQRLSPANRIRLEETVLAFAPYKQVPPKRSAEERFERLNWIRQDRLRLLRAFPEDCLSTQAKRFKAEEERALPGTRDEGIQVDGGIEISPVVGVLSSSLVNLGH